MQSHDELYKLLTIGDSGVGKTSLLLRFCNDTFTDNFITTVGVDFRYKTLDIDGKLIKLQVWDTAGQERFRTITTAYYKGAHGIMLVYDVTDRKTFEQVSTSWLETVRQNASQNGVMCLVGNKCDRSEHRQVTIEEGEAFAKENDMPFFEASAKSGLNVEEMFSAIARILSERVGVEANDTKQKAMLDISASNDGGKKCKCNLL